jgi:hypothetical protein
MRQLQGLKNVNRKIFLDKQYADQLWEDGMDYVSKRRKREAMKQVNEYDRQVKNRLIKSKYPDVEGLNQWKQSQVGLEASKSIVEREERRNPQPDKPLAKFREIKPDRIRRNYVQADFNAGFVNIGPPVKDWLPRTPKTYY